MHVKELPRWIKHKDRGITQMDKHKDRGITQMNIVVKELPR
jgi:hypothetical protein